MSSKIARLLAVGALLLALAAAEVRPLAAGEPDFWAGLWGVEDDSAAEGDFWAGLWGDDGSATTPAAPGPTAKPVDGKLHKI